MNTPIFCINLESATNRKLLIQTEWIDKLGLNINFWKATPKNNEKLKFINKILPNLNRELFDGEIALIDSYVQLLEHIQNSNIKEVIIMEDDVFPNPIFNLIPNINLSNILDQYIKLCTQEFPELNLLLMHRISCANSFRINTEFDFCYKVGKHHVWGAQMNYYNSIGIEKMFNNLKDYRCIVDNYHIMDNLRGYIGLTKTPFAFHYETKAYITHKNYNSDINAPR